MIDHRAAAGPVLRSAPHADDDEPADDGELAGRIHVVAGKLVRRLRASAPEPPGLQRVILVELSRQGPLRQSELRRIVGVGASTMSRALTALSRAGLVERTIEEDLRCNVVSLSLQGAVTLRTVDSRDGKLLRARLERLSPEAHATLVAALPVLEALATD